MRRRISGERVGRSSPFRKARERARKFAQDPGKLNALLDAAIDKAQARKAQLLGVWDSLLSCFRLLRAYATGQYRDIPWASLISIIAAVVYFVMPVDLIPDILFSLGLVDDAALIGWILAAVKSDVDGFLEWELQQANAEDDDRLALPDDNGTQS